MHRYDAGDHVILRRSMQPVRTESTQGTWHYPDDRYGTVITYTSPNVVEVVTESGSRIHVHDGDKGLHAAGLFTELLCRHRFPNR